MKKLEKYTYTLDNLMVPEAAAKNWSNLSDKNADFYWLDPKQKFCVTFNLNCLDQM